MPKVDLSPLRSVTAVALALGVASCGEENRYIAPPLPKVEVTVALQQSVTRYLEATGTTAAINSANLVARVQGFLQEVKYEDGAVVKKGTPLFVIEPQPYQLKYEQAKAAETGAQASLTQLEADYQRQSDLASKQVASKAALDQSLAARDGGQAKLAQSQVDTKTAVINLGYTQVNAPFDGIVTARQVSIGELVGGAGSPTVLATIVQHDPLYINFNISERDVQKLIVSLAQRGLKPADMKGTSFEVGLQTEAGFPHKGTLEYAAPAVNQATGTLTIRGTVANPDRKLLPGYFVRVRVPVSSQPALLVPDTALGTDQGGRYLLVANADNVVETRKVEVGPMVGELRVIDSGVTPSDRVVTTGLLRAIPGQKVDPQERPLTPPAAAR